MILSRGDIPLDIPVIFRTYSTLYALGIDSEASLACMLTLICVADRVQLVKQLPL